MVAAYSGARGFAFYDAVVNGYRYHVSYFFLWYRGVYRDDVQASVEVAVCGTYLYYFCADGRYYFVFCALEAVSGKGASFSDRDTDRFFS